MPDRLRLSNEERSTIAQIGKRLGPKGLQKLATVARPDTILGWFRRLVAQKFDGSKQRSYLERPASSPEVVSLILRLARENSSWGYDRIAGALTNLGHKVSDQTVGNILRRHGIAPAPKRSQTTAWKDFIASHLAVMTGIDFFTVGILTWRGLITYYVLFVIQLETRRVILAGVTRHPTKEWMQQSCRKPHGFRIRHIRSTNGFSCMIVIRSSVRVSDPSCSTQACSRSGSLPAPRI